ncbi:MAG TPA: adenosine kinase [Acidimicrobiales bacterium]|nr:adenosine kinase [Acidimicrobiales bacterium]
MNRRHSKNLDVVAIGNALVDVLARAGDDLISTLGLTKGTMSLVGPSEVAHASSVLAPEKRISGGSAANTAVGVASLGANAGFIGRVAKDELGRVFTDDITSSGVEFRHPSSHRPTSEQDSTGHCFILVTPDAERTMATYLGVAGQLTQADIDESMISRSRITYLEGYLWDLPQTKDALRHAMEISHSAGQLVALSLSDPFVVERHRSELQELIEGSMVDIVFGNEEEVKLLYSAATFEEGAKLIAATGALSALTRGAKGSVVISGADEIKVDARIKAGVVDTTGAGDLYAAGFLSAMTLRHPEHAGKQLLAEANLERCAQVGSLAAAEIISHMGSRPVVSLAKLARAEELL